MIAGGFGSCSTLVHLIAQHPKVALMIGVVGTVVYLGGSAGPGYHPGNKKSIAVLSEQVKSSSEDAQIRTAFDAIMTEEMQVPESVIKDAISKCGCDLTVRAIEGDRALLRDTVFVYFLDLAHTYGITQAQERLKGELITKSDASIGGIGTP
jgi:hypothetical protein